MDLLRTQHDAGLTIITAQAPPRLRTTFAALDHAIDAHIAEAQIAA